MHDNDAHTALLRVFWTWFFVGLSQMSPLQWAQFLATLLAIVFTLAQFYVLWRDKIARNKPDAG
jgi:hypothetical protein